MSEKSTNVKNEIIEWIKALFIAGAIVLLVRWLAFNPFIVDGRSMEPTFHHSEKMIVNKLVYTFREPRRGEVIVFLAPEGKDYIKRVIGLPGEKVKVIGDDVYINGNLIDEPYIEAEVHRAREAGGSYNHGFYSATEELTVPEEAVFVLGDNRPRSEDSRSPNVGFVPYKNIVGRADVVYWPLKQIRFVKHGNEVE